MLDLHPSVNRQDRLTHVSRPVLEQLGVVPGEMKVWIEAKHCLLGPHNETVENRRFMSEAKHSRNRATSLSHCTACQIQVSALGSASWV